MNLLSALLLDAQPLDIGALPLDGVTLRWLAEVAPWQWQRAAGAATGRSEVPPLSVVLDELASHPLAPVVTRGVLPVVRTDRWGESYAAMADSEPTEAPSAWVEFIPVGDELGVLVPQQVDELLTVALFARPAPFALYGGANRPLATVLIRLGGRLRGGAVTVDIGEDGCGMSATGDCAGDGRCRRRCSKAKVVQNNGIQAFRCLCDESVLTEPAVATAFRLSPAEVVPLIDAPVPG
jgi:hypothetical protein